MAQEVKPTTTAPAFVWKIKNFSMLTPNKLYSDTFVVGGYKWRLLVFPKGNKVDDHLSLYLDVADSSKLPDGWSIDIESFSITVVNKIRFEYSVAKATKHRFHATEGDWGFTSFMPLEKLHDPNLGFVIDNTLVVGAHLSISAPPSPHLSYNDRASRFIKMVHFRSLDKPKVDEFCLELLTLNTYDDVVKTVANRIGFDDPSKIRLTSHNCYSHHPNPQPIQYRGVDHLSDMLLPYNQTSDILYYEVLDIPLPELQGLKNLKVAFHHATKDEVVIHNIRLPKQSTVRDLINELKTKVELSHPNAELRLLEVFYHKIFKIFPPNEKLENINDQYWTLRAEEIPEEEKNLGPHDQLIHVYHFNKQSQMQVQNFGEPFFLVINEGETLGEVKVRIQKKLQVPDEEFSKWKFAFLSLGHPEYLQGSDIVFSRFARRDVYGAWEQYLGLEHSDNAPKRSYAAKQTSDKVLDIPLPELQGLKSLKVAFHHTTKDEVMVKTYCFISSASKLMAQQVKPSTVKSTSFSLVIKNFTNSKTKKLYSDVFIAFGYKWRLFVDPKGNNGNVLWVYLEVVDFAKLPSDWSINVQFGLTLINQIVKEDSIKKYGKCKFCAGQTDWGFPYFLPLTELSKGYLVNDTVIVEIDVSEESTLCKLNIFAESTPLMLEKSKNLLTELSILKITGKSTSASSSGISGSAMQQERKALKGYLALSLEAIDQANGFNEIEKIILLLLQHSANSHERTILRDFVSRVAALKEIVPATKSSIENVRAQNMSLVGKKADLRARLKRGQEKLCSLEVQFSKLLQEKRELEEDVVSLMTEEGEPRQMNSVALELERMNQKVSKDIEEWREISKEAEQASNQWLQAREKLAQANLSWQLFKQNLELCEN